METEQLHFLHIAHLLQLMRENEDPPFAVRDIDWRRGRGILNILDRCFWLKDGRRVDIAPAEYFGVFDISVTVDPDPDRPPPQYFDTEHVIWQRGKGNNTLVMYAIPCTN